MEVAEAEDIPATRAKQATLLMGYLLQQQEMCSKSTQEVEEAEEIKFLKLVAAEEGDQAITEEAVVVAMAIAAMEVEEAVAALQS